MKFLGPVLFGILQVNFREHPFPDVRCITCFDPVLSQAHVEKYERSKLAHSGDALLFSGDERCEG